MERKWKAIIAKHDQFEEKPIKGCQGRPAEQFLEKPVLQCEEKPLDQCGRSHCEKELTYKKKWNWDLEQPRERKLVFWILKKTLRLRKS